MIEESCEERGGYVQTHGDLFESVQTAHIFHDSKTFVDAVPQQRPDTIMDTYRQQRDDDGFDLRAFVEDRFRLPEEPGEEPSDPREKPMEDHIIDHWDELTRPAHEDTMPCDTLIPLPHQYVVPGGRFREIYYWDTYFSCEGLAACGELGTVKAMIGNIAHLIDVYGFMPNGNRVYFLSRSQPPVFIFLLELLERYEDTDTVLPYLPQLEQEYWFWMDGHDTLDPYTGDNPDAATNRRAVKIAEDTVLNRYWDETAAPRPESYREDLALTRDMDDAATRQTLRSIRAASESGWDFSSRWFPDDPSLAAIRTTDILPVDLNAFLYRIEHRLADWHAAKEHPAKEDTYRALAEERRDALDRYCWDADEGYYFDYDWRNQEQTDVLSTAAVAPLFCGMASQEQADAVADTLEDRFLHDGGLVTTLTETGEQWDMPNGWAPIQWMAVNGLRRYGHDDLADTIADRWIDLNRAVYQRTGKMMEKYNVRDVGLRAGGGEYPLQDGFGWTNGIAIALLTAAEQEPDTGIVAPAAERHHQ